MRAQAPIFVLSLLSLTVLSSLAPAETCRPLKSVKQIICQATMSYEKDTPNQKSPASGIKIFTVGTRKGVKPQPGNFLLAEYGVDEKGGLAETSNQQYSFCLTESGRLSFEFLAPWKASGELQIITNDTASGSINQKDHVTEVSCRIKR